MLNRNKGERDAGAELFARCVVSESGLRYTVEESRSSESLRFFENKCRETKKSRDKLLR